MRRTTATVLTTLALVGAGTTPTHADNVQVRTSASTGNPASYLTYVDCTDSPDDLRFSELLVDDDGVYVRDGDNFYRFGK